MPAYLIVRRAGPLLAAALISGFALGGCVLGSNQVEGEGNQVEGSGNNVKGKNNKVNGWGNTVSGDGNSM